jgi:predicted nucleotidyltransferase component of viral defense system
VRVIGSLLPERRVQVEIGYREAVVDDPDRTYIGASFYKRFEILTMTVPEKVAEKPRAMAQRVRATDLADLAELLTARDVRDSDVARFAAIKVALVKHGHMNCSERIERNLKEMAAGHDDVVPAVFLGACRYCQTMAIVWPRIKVLIS